MMSILALSLLAISSNLTPPITVDAALPMFCFTHCEALSGLLPL